MNKHGNFNALMNKCGNLNEGFSGKVEHKTKVWVDYVVCEVLDSLLNNSATNFNYGSVVSSFWLVCNFCALIKNAESCLFIFLFAFLW